jgi:hypothetical protein
MIGKLLKDDGAQGAIEYVLLAGGIIVAALVIFIIYTELVQDTATMLNGSVNTISGEMESDINKYV